MKPRIIAFNRPVKPRAREVRSNLARAEAILWRELKAKRLLGCDFERKQLLERRVIDFYCSRLMIAIEVDAVEHVSLRAVRDDERHQARLERQGLTVLRYTGDEIVHNLEGVVSSIRREVRARGSNAFAAARFDRAAAAWGGNAFSDPLRPQRNR
jgi:very-short-patch-repair endonuclease